MDLFDIHCHLLPGVDDGIAEWTRLKKIFRLYKSSGFSGLSFTPHLYNPFVRTDVKGIRMAYQRAAEEAKEEGLVTLLSSEVFIENEEVIKGVPLAGEYMLVEFNLNYAPSRLMEKLESLHPLKPIIAHIERYRWLSPESEAVDEMKEKGYLFQVNGKALKTDKKAKAYLDAGLIDVLASDCHGRESDIIDLAEMISSHPDIMSKMSQMARHLKEVV